MGKKTSAVKPDAARPVKVAHVIWSLGLGGAEQVVLGLVRNMDRSRYQPIVICLDDKGPFASGAEEAGVPVLELKKKRGADFLLPFRLAGLLREQKVKLVHTHLFNGHLWGRLAALIAGLPVVSTEHGMDQWRTSLHHAFDTLLTLKNSRMIFVSEEARAFYRSRVPAFKGRDCVFFNGIETARFSGRDSRDKARAELGFSPGAWVVGTAGRFVPEKRHDVFFAALKALRARGLDAKGLVIGGGPLQESVEGNVRDAGLSDHVVLTGVRQDLPDLYPAMDVFMLSSDREGLPITILEAMAAGVPVVSTNVGGIHACVRPGETGWLVPPGDAEALALAAYQAYSDAAQTRVKTDAARKLIKNEFSVEAMTAQYEALYDEVLK